MLAAQLKQRERENKQLANKNRDKLKRNCKKIKMEQNYKKRWIRLKRI